MAINLFGAPSKNDIKVGYIDPSAGYVDGITICQANEYAKKNPGTVFIFRDGNNNLRYLNINNVNKLTTNDLVSTGSTCGGIQDFKECGPPTIQIFGGGGIGAAGNPVVGFDGSILAVDVIRGGHGYQYPPLVAAKDECENGNGASFISILGEVSETTETYDDAEDFEEYELCPDDAVGYGRRWGQNGEDLGAWEPSSYSKLSEDPIKREIEKYQQSLINPFWTTRSSKSTKVSSLGEYFTLSNVTHPEWNEFMNKYAISPVRPSELTGSDYAGRIFTMEWVEEFPSEGEYIFRGLCDNTASVFVDNQEIGSLKSFKDSVTPIRKVLTEGLHSIRIDLLNVPIKEIATITSTTSNSSDLKAKFVKDGSKYYLQVDGTGTAEISFVMDVNDSPIIAGLAAKEVIIPSNGGNVKFSRKEGLPSVNAKNQTIGQSTFVAGNYPQYETINKSGKFTGGIKYGPIQIIGADPSARGPFIKNSNTLSIRDADGDDENIKVTITKVKQSTSSTTTTEVIGEVISPKSWYENPIGVSMSIDAPPAPVPQEPIPPQEGRCPPNPIWTTRFPGSTQKWYPVRFSRPDTWSKFMNRYALSPIPPLNTPGSDISGATFSNSWQVDLPYAGFYGVKGTRDNRGRLLIDGNLISELDGFNISNPRLTKVFLEKGRHTITVEVLNQPVVTNTVIDTKIFSTQDWRAALTPSAQTSSSLTAKFIKQGANFYLQVDGTGTGDISFVMDVNDSPIIAGLAAKEVKIPSDSGKVKFSRQEGLPSVNAKNQSIGQSTFVAGNYAQYETIKNSGTFTGGKKYGPIEIIGADPGAKGPIINNSNRLGIRDADGNDENIKITIDKITSKGSAAPTSSTSVSKTNSNTGVTYVGPELFGHSDSRWSEYMNNFSVSPKVFTSTSAEDSRVVGVYTLTWKNVNFPYDGVYKFNFQADNIATLKISGREIYKTSDFIGQKIQYTFNLTKGKYDIEITLENKRSGINNKTDTIFLNNPMGTALYISKDVTLSETNKTPWTDNPVAISAILIPPPCPKLIRGKGVVKDIIPLDPGNGYIAPASPGTGYPVTLELVDIIVENPGINYSCGVDEIQIVPNNGTQVTYNCDSFGRINSVNVVTPGIGYNVYPTITMPSETGVNATFRPVFRVVRDPVAIEVPPDQLIQVTDLVGLKQTGYYQGRPYYGAIYYEDGLKYAGYYKTAGTPIRIYDTLQESITGEVTTPASAIQRSGTDIRSNDPRLNIPNTPQNTTEL